MGTTRLAIYNGALMLCSERSIATLTVNEEGRRLLDAVWNDGGVQACLEEGQWKFAIRGAKIGYDPSIAPAWGYSKAFPKPSDWVNTSAICSDERFNVSLTQYTDEVGVWFADLETLYVKFVSNDVGYGTNYAAWPASFTEYVKAYFASKIIAKLTADEARRNLILAPRSGLLAQARITALNRDAMAGPAKFRQPGSWPLARIGGRNRGPWRDGGNSGSLIG